jgi:hypothetical protein
MKVASIGVVAALLAATWPLSEASADKRGIREISRMQYDGVTDDLLTGGICKSQDLI